MGKLHIVTDIKEIDTFTGMSKNDKAKKEDKPAATKVSKTEEKEKKSNLGALEEDDDFEEFPAEDWTTDDNVNNSDVMQVWEDDWDDDDVEDDFSHQLRSELEKHGQTKK